MRKKLISIGCLSTIILFILGFFYYKVFYYDLAVPQIFLNGNKTETIGLRTNYVEPGYEAKVDNKRVDYNIKVSNDINNKRPGTYEVYYSVKNKLGDKTTTKVRRVIVADETSPIITLTGGTISLYTGSIYKEPGYKAIDDYDGDITKNVITTSSINTTKAGSYWVKYTVKDSSDNKTSISRKVDVIDSPKVITNSNEIPILMYHFFYDSSLGEKPQDSNWVDIATFEEEISYLKNNNYYFPSWSELEEYVAGKLKLPSKSIIITIDDGNESFFRLAYPVLKKHDVKATSFIVTSWTNISNYNVDRNIIDFESHSNNMHRGTCKCGHGGIFQCISYQDGYNDLITSIKALGNNEVFAYPFGDYNDKAIQIVKDAGFKMAVTTKYGKVKVGDNKFLLPRVRIQGTYKINNFINAIK